jgi:hypothetical protein
MTDEYTAKDDLFIARAWSPGPTERDITLWRNGGWPFSVGSYIEIEVGVDAPRSLHVHGFVLKVEGDKVVIRGRDATNPRKVWAVT